MIVVADTGPLLYLSLIDQAELLPKLYGSVSISTAVAEELLHPNTPLPIRLWVQHRPPWLSLHANALDQTQWLQLDRGERASLSLALQLNARLLLTDDSAARTAAQSAGLSVRGTLGVLYQGATDRHLQGDDMAFAFELAVARLRRTNFFFSAKLDAALSSLTAILHRKKVD